MWDVLEFLCMLMAWVSSGRPNQPFDRSAKPQRRLVPG